MGRTAKSAPYFDRADMGCTGTEDISDETSDVILV